MRYKLIAFDMDGTLVLEESCWRALHVYYRTEEKARLNLDAYERAEIDYPEFMRRDISLWQPPPTLEEIKKVLGRYELVPNVREVLREIHARGYRTAIVTGGIDVLAEEVARELRIQHVMANGLEVDKRGRLTGEGIFRVEPNRKDEVLERFAAGLGIEMEECVAVGDSKYDVMFLKRAGLGVAVGGSPELTRVADVVIKDFEHFPQLLDYL